MRIVPGGSGWLLQVELPDTAPSNLTATSSLSGQDHCSRVCDADHRRAKRALGSVRHQIRRLSHLVAALIRRSGTRPRSLTAYELRSTLVDRTRSITTVTRASSDVGKVRREGAELGFRNVPIGEPKRVGCRLFGSEVGRRVRIDGVFGCPGGVQASRIELAKGDLGFETGQVVVRGCLSFELCPRSLLVPEQGMGSGPLPHGGHVVISQRVRLRGLAGPNPSGIKSPNMREFDSCTTPRQFHVNSYVARPSSNRSRVIGVPLHHAEITSYAYLANYEVMSGYLWQT